MTARPFWKPRPFFLAPALIAVAALAAATAAAPDASQAATTYRYQVTVRNSINTRIYVFVDGYNVPPHGAWVHPGKNWTTTFRSAAKSYRLGAKGPVNTASQRVATATASRVIVWDRRPARTIKFR